MARKGKGRKKGRKHGKRTTGQRPDPQVRFLARRGVPEAQLRLGIMYGLGEDGIRKNAFKAAKWYLAAARQGMPEAQFLIGLMYRDGDGVPRDAAEGVRWMRAAAERGHTDAQSSLAEAYLDGEGVEQDFEEAARWYRTAAEGGDPDASFNLGMMYADCLADMDNDPDAEEWLKVAADAGHESARYLLGELGVAGYPSIDDDNEARRPYRAPLGEDADASIQGGGVVIPMAREETDAAGPETEVAVAGRRSGTGQHHREQRAQGSLAGRIPTRNASWGTPTSTGGGSPGMPRRRSGGSGRQPGRAIPPPRTISARCTTGERACRSRIPTRR